MNHGNYQVYQSKFEFIPSKKSMHSQSKTRYLGLATNITLRDWSDIRFILPNRQNEFEHIIRQANSAGEIVNYNAMLQLQHDATYQTSENSSVSE